MNTFFLILIGLPALEIFIMIKIGEQIGAFNTISLIFLTAIIGIYYARIQGIQTLRSGIINIYQNKAPVFELMSGASIACAALFLIIPGFLTDSVGFILLFPFSRKILLRIIFRKRKKTNETRHNIKTIDGEIINKDKDEL
ncbi:FxsA family protein [Candidatus Pelagibacter communis]|uniref:FxsA family protein n=1 Tax=Pelagibacter ubique TaxID=198252 RepID=UPI00094D430C|nr:FxsA family protein [Candidatus Pelagibacter ubique]